MSLNFTWSELWEYHNALVDPALKAHLEEEIIGNGWLQGRTAKEQEKVLVHAPHEFVERVATIVKPEVAIKMGINPYMRRVT